MSTVIEKNIFKKESVSGERVSVGSVWTGVHCLASGDQGLSVATLSRYGAELIPQSKLGHCHKGRM